MSLFDRQTYIVKERVAFAKLTDTYDLLDAQTAQPIGVAKEEPAAWAKWLRLVVKKQLMPTTVNVYESETAPPVLSIKRGVALFRPKATVSTPSQEVGFFQAKVFSIGPSFTIHDAQQREIGSVKGDWKGWNFQLLGPSGEELGRVTKKWAGLGKELFTSADTYAISISDSAAGRRDVAQLLLAAGLAIDTIYKEKN
ncbi:MAG TPA: phospholipid scramblase-related protein [Thermoanaerobaculia bacterium]|nr:phospholipid scramblase-related protein [Thermoanaerobaculia bacterium]